MTEVSAYVSPCINMDPSILMEGSITTVQPPLPPPSYNRILVFDTETTGLLPKRTYKTTDLSVAYPYITQLSFIIYDLKQRSILQVFDSYVKIPEGVEIPEIVTQKTGITAEKCATEGRNICDVLRAFYNAYLSADCVVAHNMAFDSEMIHLESVRNAAELLGECPDITKMLFLCDKPKECTIKLTTRFCNLTAVGFGGKPFAKMPKLEELYDKLFGVIPENLHNSLVDTLVCLRCYLKYRWDLEIPDFESLISQIL